MNKIVEADLNFNRKWIFAKRDEIKANESAWKTVVDVWIPRWEEIKFLEGLDANEKELVAVAFEQMASIMLFSKHKFWDDFMEVFSFPIIRKVISEVGDKFDIEVFYLWLKQSNLGEMYDNILWFTSTEGVDVNGEFLALAIESFEYRLNSWLNGEINKKGEIIK